MTCPIGKRHSWWSRGLDIVRGRLVYCYRCSFCGASRTTAYRIRGSRA